MELNSDSKSKANLRPTQRRRPRWRRVFWRIAGTYAVVLLLVVMGCADRLILFPSNQPIPMPGIVRGEISSATGKKLEIWKARSAGASAGTEPRAYVLAFIGNADRAEPSSYFTALEWGDRPVEVWAVNYPGFGGSPGPAHLSTIGPASLAAYDELARVTAGKPIFVQAQSIGTTAALHVAANRNVAGCVLKNPPPLSGLIMGEFGWWNLWLLATPVSLSIPSDLDSIKNAKRVQAPGLFLLAESDEVVPPKYQKRVVGAFAGERREIVLRGAHHNDPVDGAAVGELDSALDWLWDRAVAKRPVTTNGYGFSTRCTPGSIKSA